MAEDPWRAAEAAWRAWADAALGAEAAEVLSAVVAPGPWMNALTPAPSGEAGAAMTALLAEACAAAARDFSEEMAAPDAWGAGARAVAARWTAAIDARLRACMGGEAYIEAQRAWLIETARARLAAADASP